jgi:Glycosyltransferase family 87
VFEALTSELDVAGRVRVLRVLALAMALVFVMVGVSSPLPVDVIYAVMEGATRLVHGVIPYGHMPGDIVHGDTYPLFSYVAYMPLAVLSPVSSTWDSVDLALGAAVAMTLAGAGALFRAVAGAARAGASRRTAEAEAAGLRAALIWLSFPALLITVSTGTTDVVLAVLLLFAVLLWRRPGASCAMLAVAGWFKLAPFALVPIWLAPLRGRRLLTGLAALAGVSLAMLALLVGFGGTGGPAAMAHAMAFQFSRGSPQSLWTVLGVGWLQPLAQAGALALIAGATVRLWRDPELAADRVRIAALAAAVLLALQLVADYWAFLYVAWVVPLMAISLLAEPVPARRTAVLAARRYRAFRLPGPRALDRIQSTKRV